MDKIYVIDRFEGDKAILLGDDSDEALEIDIRRLPEGAGEGDCLRFDGGEPRLEPEAARERKERAEALFSRLTGRDKKSF